jgi:8-oxo-dGTP pyrophosphatase MutT (NUDIX family)
MDTPNEPLFVDSGTNAVRPDSPLVEREAITAVLYDPRSKKILGLRWKEVDWETFVTGGIEKGQTAVEATQAEILEETGYKNVRLVRELPRYHSKFFHHPKKENRLAHFQCFLFELLDDDQVQISAEEEKKHEPVWLSMEELKTFNLPEGHRFVLEHAKKILDETQ